MKIMNIKKLIRTKGSESNSASGLKDKAENASGLNLNDIQIHYNSNIPNTLQAKAFTKGNHIYLSTGEETCLPHELWHVVQQKQHRVPIDYKANGNAFNVNPLLEKEADMMGKHILTQNCESTPIKQKQFLNSQTSVIQRVILPGSFINFLPDEYSKTLSFYNKIQGKLKILRDQMCRQNYQKAVQIREVMLALLEDRVQNPPLSNDENRCRELQTLYDALKDGGELAEQIEKGALLESYKNSEDVWKSGASIKKIRDSHKMQDTLDEIHSGALRSIANQHMAQYIPNSLQIHIRHKIGRDDDHHGEGIFDEIEVVFQIHVDNTTEVNDKNLLDICGVRFEYMEHQINMGKLKVLNSVYTSAPQSPSMAGTQSVIGLGGLSGFQITPIDARLGEDVIHGYKSVNSLADMRSLLVGADGNGKILTIAMRDIPGVTKLDTMPQYTFHRNLSFRIAIQDHFDNFSEVYLKQQIHLINGNLDSVHSKFIIGKITDAHVHITSIDKVTKADDLMPNPNLQIIHNEMNHGEQNYFSFDENLDIEAMMGPILHTMRNRGDDAFFLQLNQAFNRLPNSSRKIIKSSLDNRNLKYDQLSSPGFKGAGGITTNIFDILYFYKIPQTNYDLVGAYKGNVLLYAFVCCIDTSTPNFERADTRQPFPGEVITYDNLFKKTQYEEIPMQWIMQAISI